MKTYNTMWHHHGGGHGPPLHQLMREHTRKEEQEEKTAGEDRQGLNRVSAPMGQPPWPDTVGSDWPQKAPSAGQSQVPQPCWRCLWKNVFKKMWRDSLAERSERGKKSVKNSRAGAAGGAEALLVPELGLSCGARKKQAGAGGWMHPEYLWVQTSWY